MSYCVSHMIGIRTGGVFSGAVDMKNLEKRIRKVLDDSGTDIGDLKYCMSKDLSGKKGSYVVLAGVFNHWDFDQASIFVKKLSKEFVTEVMHMAWDEQRDYVQCQIWLNGKPLFEVSENSIGQIFRRIS